MALKFNGEWLPLDMTIVSQELDFLRDKPEQWTVGRCACNAYVLALPSSGWLDMHAETLQAAKQAALLYYKFGEAQLKAIFTGGRDVAKLIVREGPGTPAPATPTPTITKTA